MVTIITFVNPVGFNARIYFRRVALESEEVAHKPDEVIESIWTVLELVRGLIKFYL